MIRLLTIPQDAAVSNGASYVNANVLQNTGNQLFPVAIQCPAALTTDTTFLIEWEFATGQWSEIRSTNGAADPKAFFANGTVPFDAFTAAFLKDKNIRVRCATNQAAARVFSVHYAAL